MNAEEPFAKLPLSLIEEVREGRLKPQDAFLWAGLRNLQQAFGHQLQTSVKDVGLRFGFSTGGAQEALGRLQTAGYLTITGTPRRLIFSAVAPGEQGSTITEIRLYRKDRNSVIDDRNSVIAPNAQYNVSRASEKKALKKALKKQSALSLLPDSKAEKTKSEKEAEHFISRWNSEATPLGLPQVQDRTGSKTFQSTVKKLTVLFKSNPLFRDSVDAFFENLKKGFSFDWRPSLIDLLGNNRTGMPKWEKLVSGEYLRTGQPARQVPKALQHEPDHYARRLPDA